MRRAMGIRVLSDGALIAVGTETDSIRMIGLQDAQGQWNGLRVESNDPRNALRYVELAGAGIPALFAGLTISSATAAQLSLTESLIRSSGAAGAWVAMAGRFSEFSGNDFRDHAGVPLMIPAREMGVVDAASTFSGNERDALLVTGGSVSSGQTWKATHVPFELEDKQTIGVEAAVVAEPGFHLRFGQQGRLVVESGGSLEAVGTEQDSIRFTAASNNPAPGFWSSLTIETASLDNVLDYVEVGHAGSVGANIFLLRSDAALTVTNSRIHDSETWGIWVASGASLTEAGNTFTDNASGNIHYQ